MDTREIDYEELDKKKDDKCKHDHDHKHDKCKHDHDHKHDRRCHYEHDKKHKHVRELEHAIKALGDSLAYLGRGQYLLELQHIVKWPGWTTPAEFAFVTTILDNIAGQVRLLERLQADLVEASKKVADKRHKHYEHEYSHD
ncbi:MAG: hypothetical protein ACLGI6_00780 [Gammaproteobacteria bacterium]